MRAQLTTKFTKPCCISDGCGKPYDAPGLSLDYREGMRPFWYRYCPEHRFDGKEHPAIVAVEAKRAVAPRERS